MDRNNWKLGDTAALFESRNGADTISSGSGDHGGASYGIYQFSSSAGTAREFARASRYAEEFKGLVPGTKAFDAAWRKVASDHPDFGDDQHQFIKKTHVDPVSDALLKRGIDVDSRGDAFQDMIWSMSVQHRKHTPALVERGLRESYGEDVDISALSDVDIIRAVHRSKVAHVHEDFRSSDIRIREGVETRIYAEERALVRLAETGTVGTVAESKADWRNAPPVRPGSPHSQVVEVQEKLQALGVLNAKGERLVADGDFGPSTQSAVRTFQSSVGLPITGAVSTRTMHFLNEQVNTRQLTTELRAADRVPAPICRLDDPAHPDNAFFNQVRGHVVELDRTLGRSPDHHTDSIASALTVQARADGLDRIDRIALSKDGNALWGAQTPPGRKDHVFDLTTKVPTAEALTPMEQSGARWPEAMQQFQNHEQEHQQTQQQSLERTQAENQAHSMSGPVMRM
ncbi:VgrG-related protein [Luteibacter yeojuensis]